MIRNDDRVWAAMQNRKPPANFWVTYAVISTGDENAKKLVPGKKNLRRASRSADDISKSGTRRYALDKAKNWRASKERKKERQNENAILKISTVKGSEKLQPILSALGTRMQSTI